MTQPLAKVIDSRIKRRPGRPSSKDDYSRQTFADSLSSRIRQAQTALVRLRFPNVKYQARPVDFARDVLGVEPWEKQIEIINAVRDHMRVAVSAGHKVSKSHSAAILALWFYCSFVDARVIMSSTTSRQVDQILWRETRMMRARSGRCVACKLEDPEGFRIPKPCPHSAEIEGDMGDMARTGLKAPDFREIVGFTAREAEAVAGISGSNLLYILDEASGINDMIFESIEGNRAGGARVIMFSNPTRNTGEFFDAFHSKSRFYHTIRVSSEDSPNVKAGRVIIPGLATREWIDEKRDEWGEDSPLYRIRIKGEHATHEEGRIFNVHTIEQAEAAWYTQADAGRLYIGVDVAGDSGTGDESMMAPRRGLKLLKLMPARGLTAEAHVDWITQAVLDMRLPREKPVVVVDAEGPIGIKVSRLLADYLDVRENKDMFELVRIYASKRAVRNPAAYQSVRDELAANLSAWFGDGGAIVEDARLAAELHVFEWIELPNGRVKCTPKDAIRKLLGRSPDRYDALALSTWEPLSLRADQATQRTVAERSNAIRNDNASQQFRERAMDPYAAMDPWRARR